MEYSKIYLECVSLSVLRKSERKHRRDRERKALRSNRRKEKFLHFTGARKPFFKI